MSHASPAHIMWWRWKSMGSKSIAVVVLSVISSEQCV
ncbi:hypothetical protein SAMN05216378_1248 [Paenibacillus catalpae]|uniref:Uncharacterized protein n=1 Tax=Paenibacillus catalpae TaxID=1045775 RepID=A0A1I1UVU1_9BACL|nr:hypothetical protein SAMN05216378_1248 [Paenibacillus catalpae]